ncbi:MAG TPA: AtpZ/AtpI family protein [Acidimicrobiia bacterium]|jgi:ATP synthase protein I
MKRKTATNQIASAVSEGWVQAGSFLGSILSGTLLGWLADRWLGTSPWLLVIGIVLGSYSGFMVMWRQSAAMEAPREH